MSDIDYLDGNTVYFKDGEAKEYDLIVCATGYKLAYPFIDKKYLNWKDGDNCPNLYLNIFNPQRNNIFVLGMIEATGIGWQGRYNQAELVAKFIQKDLTGQLSKIAKFMTEKTQNTTDLRAGMNYLKLERMSFYVHKETYMKKVDEMIEELN
jgi:NADH dehydrogenase FAD-containing subunit